MQYYRVGKIINTHGIKGEVRVNDETDFAKKRFKPGATLYLGNKEGGVNQKLVVEKSRPFKGTWLVKFKGFDNINDVLSFKNHELLVSEADQQELPKGRYYYHQIIGLTVVTTEGRKLGKITEIIPGANDVWTVKKENGKEILLPVIKQVIKKVDLETGIVTVELMEGLE